MLNLKNLILLFGLVLSNQVLAQNDSLEIIGEWFQCSAEDIEIGDTIILKKDDCRKVYADEDFKSTISWEFTDTSFCYSASNSCLAGGYMLSFWNVVDTNLLQIGHELDDIIYEYEIVRMNNQELFLRKLK